MPHDAPDLSEILRTSREFVDDITPRLDGQDRYHAMCVGYLLEIASRELEQWAPLATADDRRLQELLGGGRSRSPGALVAELSQAIRGGEFDGRMDDLLEGLIAHVASKVSVSKPSYLPEPD